MSPDGISWQPISDPLPEGAPTYADAGEDILAVAGGFATSTIMGPISYRQVWNRAWIPDDNAAVLYRRVGADWDVVPLPSVPPPTAKGLRATGPEFSTPTALDEANWIMPVGHLVKVPWEDLYGSSPIPQNGGVGDPRDPNPWSMWRDWDSSLEIYEPSGLGSPLAKLTVDLIDGAAPTIEFRDFDGGGLVHTVDATLDGWPPEAMLTALRGWGLVDTSFVVSRAGTLSIVRPPWPMDQEEGDILAADGRYVAIAREIGQGYSVVVVHVWESSDGVSWRELETPPLPSGNVRDVQLTASADRLFLSIDGDAGQSLWTMTDRETWTRADIDALYIGTPEQTGDGWLISANAAMAISTDGVTWDVVRIPVIASGASVQFMHGLFLVGPGGEGDRYVTWVGRLTPS
jgi:hypothetical protein